MNSRINVIYARFSSDLQRSDSNVNQERRCREALERMGIPHRDFIVIADEATSGTRDDRAGFQQIKELIYSDRLGILIVAEMSRLSRGADVKSLIIDIIYHGGHFISLQEGIDTNGKNWKTLVGIGEIHHSHSNDDTAARVRSAQAGRVLDDCGSAGDYPYGYTSEYIDPEAAANYRGRGPKPKKRVVIDDAASALVQEVFRRFAADESIGAIVRWWESVKSQYPPITKSRIHHEHVRRMLMNEKYIGKWRFGQTTTIRDARGKKKQIPTRPDQQMVVVERPNLRIISQELWDAAQRRLQKLKDIYGMKPEHARRGPAKHYRLLYESSLLGGLIHCSRCGAPLHVGSGGKIKRLRCPNYKAGACDMGVTVRYEKAENAILDVLAEVFSRCPSWLSAAMEHTRAAVKELASRIPDETARCQRQLKEIQDEIDNIVAAIGKGLHSEAISERLAELEAQKPRLQAALEQLQEVNDVEAKMPDQAWLNQQLENLRALLHADMSELARAMRPLLGRITAEPVIYSTKERGYAKLTFRLEGWAMLKQMLVGQLPDHILALLKPADADGGETFEIDLGQPTRYDLLAPKVVAMRNAGHKWREIAAATGIAIGNASNLYARHVKAQAAQKKNEPTADPNGQAA